MSHPSSSLADYATMRLTLRERAEAGLDLTGLEPLSETDGDPLGDPFTRHDDA